MELDRILDVKVAQSRQRDDKSCEEKTQLHSEFSTVWVLILSQVKCTTVQYAGIATIMPSYRTKCGSALSIAAVASYL